MLKKRSFQIVNRVIKFCSLISGVALVFLMIFVAVDIFMRLFNHPIIGSAEITVVTVVVIIWLGIPYCDVQDAHIKVDVIKKGPIFDKIYHWATFAGMLFIAWACFDQGLVTNKLHNTTQLLDIPKAPFFYITAIGALLMAFSQLGKEISADEIIAIDD